MSKVSLVPYLWVLGCSATPLFQAAGHSVLCGGPEKGKLASGHVRFHFMAESQPGLLLSVITQVPVKKESPHSCSVAPHALGRPRLGGFAGAQGAESHHPVSHPFCTCIPHSVNLLSSCVYCASTWDIENKTVFISKELGDEWGRRPENK